MIMHIHSVGSIKQVNLRKSLLVLGEVDNIDHDPSSVSAQSSFCGLTIPEAPRACSDLIKCSCKSGRGCISCKCKKAGLQCTSLYTCIVKFNCYHKDNLKIEHRKLIFQLFILFPLLLSFKSVYYTVILASNL